MSRPAADVIPSTTLEDLEIRLLLEGVHQHYGYDFRDYALSSLRRRVRERVRVEGVRTITGLAEKVLNDSGALERLLLAFSISVSSMFRDPRFYLAFRQKVVPILRTYPFIRIWHAGCSTGEEVYSMAIMLEEEGLYDRCRLYATDMNEVVLGSARQGIFPLSRMKQHTANYIDAGGRKAFSEYYTASYDSAIFSAAIRRNLVFAQHNLATDGSFNEFHVIMCRNVLIYFNKTLQERVVKLCLDSLARFGFLCLGAKESLRYSAHESTFQEFDPREKIYRKRE